MATAVRTAPRATSQTNRWYALSGDEVASRLGVDPTAGLSARRAAELLRSHGPNALPAEDQVPTWRRFVDQYRSYMQIILLGAAVVSLVIQEWSTAVLLLLITILNAVVALGTRPLTTGQFGLALLAAVVLFGLWELGKRVARGRTG